MPRGDGTGPPGAGGSGRGGGRGYGRPGRCRCPNCGHTAPHEPGVPCNTKKCPRCGTPMTRS
ncbi:MAG: hypothetical protein ACP5FL_01545 [Thermoplasmatota archaeon]